MAVTFEWASNQKSNKLVTIGAITIFIALNKSTLHANITINQQYLTTGPVIKLSPDSRFLLGDFIELGRGKTIPVNS